LAAEHSASILYNKVTTLGPKSKNTDHTLIPTFIAHKHASKACA